MVKMVKQDGRTITLPPAIIHLSSIVDFNGHN